MDRRTLESTATDNAYLRGLLLVPLSALFVLAALANWGVEPLDRPWVFIAGVLVSGAAYQLMTCHYDETYGRATPSAQQQRKVVAATIAGVVIMLGLSSLLRSHAPWSLDLPVNPIAVSIALVLLISFSATVGIKRHHAIILGGLAVAGLAPVWHGGDPGNVGLVMAGAAVFLIGILDHVLLVRTLGPSVVEGSNAGA